MTTQVRTSEEGHLHRCQKCGNIWGHGDMMAEDINAHTCPKCGEAGQWRIYNGGRPYGPHRTHAIQVGKFSLFKEKNFWIITLTAAAIVMIVIAISGIVEGVKK